MDVANSEGDQSENEASINPNGSEASSEDVEMPEAELLIFERITELATYAGRGERLKSHFYSERGIYESWEQTVLFSQTNEYYSTDASGHMKDITHGLGMASWGGNGALAANARIGYECVTCTAKCNGVSSMIVRKARSMTTLLEYWCYDVYAYYCVARATPTKFVPRMEGNSRTQLRRTQDARKVVGRANPSPRKHLRSAMARLMTENGSRWAQRGARREE